MNEQTMVDAIERFFADKKMKVQPNQIFEIGKQAYITVVDKGDHPCADCCFGGCMCNLNIDIPSCNNGVIFKKLSGKSFFIVRNTNNGKVLGKCHFIDDETIEVNGIKNTVLELFEKHWRIEPMLEIEN